jgi:hypothetical protein
MGFLLDNEFAPNNILHFEHTYFINELVIENLANKCGFIVEESKNYTNHSIFYKLKKTTTKTNENLILNIKTTFENSFKKHNDKILFINELIEEYKKENNKIYLFGAHVTSQYYLNNGLSNIIDGLLDNSTSKQGYKLYGSDLIVSSPSIIKGGKCVVICSHAGVYFNEIVEQLISINKNVIII